MSLTLKVRGGMTLIFVTCIAVAMCAAESKPRDDLAIYAGFESFPPEFLDRIGLDDRKDSKHSFYVLTDLEAFFLLDRKGQEATANWPPKPNAASFGKTIRVTYQTDPPTDCSVLVRPSLIDLGKGTQLSIEAPKGSAFTLRGPVDVKLAAGDVVYLPSQTLLDNGKRCLYLVLSAVTREYDE